MVLKVLADAREFMDLLNTVLGELRLRADAREQEQLRRVDGTTSQNHFAPGHQALQAGGGFYFHTGGVFAVQQNFCDMGFG